MMKFKTLFIAFVLCAAASAAQAGCMDLPQQKARRALQILKNQIMVAEYCEKCLSPFHRLIGVRSTGIVCDEKDLCRVLINGEEVDVSYLFAENADGREENIGYAVGCPDALLYNPRYLNFER